MDINLDAIILAAEEGGKVIKKYFGQVLEIEQKTTVADFRTKADLESEKVVIEVLTKHFPDFNILSEEAGFIDKKSEYKFVIDPLDGSNNFVLGIPNFTVSKESDIKNATISYTSSYEEPVEYSESVIHKLNQFDIKRLMENWSPAFDFCMLASGKIEAIIDNGNEVYDFSAGKLLAKEAGAMVTDFQGKPEINDNNNIFIASNGTTIHQQLLTVV